jgi:cytochrome P450
MLERCRSRYGTPFTIRLPATPPFVMITDPSAVKEVFTAPPDVLYPGRGARVLEPIVGRNSVILLDGDAHLEQRKLMLPAFHGERMQALSGLMAEAAGREVERWPRHRPFELHPRLQALTLEVILRAVFGLEPGSRMDALRVRLARMLEFGDRPTSVLPADEATLLGRALSRTPAMIRFRRLQAEADAMIFELIDDRRDSGAEGDDVLAMLLAARREDGSPMSGQELRDELMTLLVAGHETTASALAWAFALLPHHPEVLARLRDAARGGEAEYVTAVAQETLRRRPVLPNAAPRLVMAPVEVGGRPYPTGVCLVANAYLVHHDPEIHPEPYRFRPERFLEASPGTYTWIPFGGGRRRCLGASFALLEMRIVLAAVAGRFELRPATPSPESPRRRAITIRPERGARVVLA